MSEQIKGLSLLIQSAESLPFLGFYSELKAYCVIKYENERHVSPISKISRNPFWMFQTQLNLSSNNKNAPIEVYIYNSNSNGQDQLLGWLHILQSQCNYITLTKTKHQLKNLQGHRIDSYLHISTQNLPPIQTGYFTGKQSIKIELLNSVQIQNEDFSTVNVEQCLVKFLYGNTVMGLKYGQRNQVIFPYQSSDQLIVLLEGIKNIKDHEKLSVEFNLKNLRQKQPQYFKVRFFDPVFPRINYVASLLLTIIPNSNLPKQYSCMQISVKSDIKENFFLRINSPLQTAVIKSVTQIKSFKLPMPNSVISFDYFDASKIQQKDLSKENDQEHIIKTLCKYKPFQSTKIQMNELEWTSTQHSQFTWPNRKEKITKHLTLQFQALKEIKQKQKQIYPTNFIASSVNKKTVKLKQLKISSCYFYQVLPLQSQLQIYHVDFYGKVVNVGSFIIKQNQSEYIVDSRLVLDNQCGQLVIVCFQLKLKDSEEKQRQMSPQTFLQNHMIFKVKTEKDKDLMSGRIIYNQNFLAFAKKVSLTKLCKKFQQAVHNQAMTVKSKIQLWMPFRKGLLQIVNCQLLGFQSFNSLQLTAGFQTRVLSGFGSQFLSQKSAFYFVQNERVLIKIVSKDKQISLHYDFNELFGNPQNTMNEVKTYLRQIDLKNGKLKIWFKFTPLDHKAQQKQINLEGDQNLLRYSQKNPVRIGVQRLKILKNQGKDILGINPQNELNLKLRMTHQSGHYESLTEKSATGTFIFDPRVSCIHTRSSINDQSRYIFLSVQLSSTKRDTSQQKQETSTEQMQKQQRFFNSVIDITKILGKGLIQVRFYDNKTGKLQIIGLFECLTQNIANKSAKLSNFPVNSLKICLKMNNSRVENRLKYLQNFTGYDKESLFKNIYSYFAVFVINGSYHSLCALDSSLKFTQQSLLPLKQFVNNQFILIDSKSIIDVRILSRLKKIQTKQLHQKLMELNIQSISLSRSQFDKKLGELDIEIIGSGRLTLGNVSYKQKDKQGKIQFLVTFCGNRQLQFKYSHEQMQILRKSAQFILTFDILKNQPIHAENILDTQQHNLKHTAQISVLKQCVGLLKINKIYTKNSRLLKCLSNGEVKISLNQEQLNYLPLDHLFVSQVAVLIEKSQLKFSLSTKNSPQIITKKLTLPSYLKTNQLWAHQVEIGEYIVSFQIECLSNGLTTFNQGKLSVREVTLMNIKADKVKLYYSIQQNQQLSYFSTEKTVSTGKVVFNTDIEIQRKLKKLLKAALFFEVFIETQKKRVLTKIHLSQLSISTKLNQQNPDAIKMQFQDQITINNGKSPFNICISGQYNIQKNDSLKQSKKIIKYNLLGGQKQKQIQVQQSILNREILSNLSQPKQNLLPSRQTGIKLQLQLPQKFISYLHESNLQSILNDMRIQGENKDQLYQLIKSKQKPNIFYKYLDKIIQVKNLIFKESQHYQGKKQGLNRFKIQLLTVNEVKSTNRPVTKFIINENPQYVLTVTQSAYQIPKAVKTQKISKPKQIQESLIFQISIHRLLALPIFTKLLTKNSPHYKDMTSQQKRLLGLKSTPNDEILTNNFCLFFKHGKQQQFLFGIDLQGNLNNSKNSIKFGYDPEDDQVDVFLCVQNYWNKSMYDKKQAQNGFFVEKYSYDQIEKKWITIMPLCHYLIKISEIKKNNFNFSSIMKPYQYSLTQASLAKQLQKRFELKQVGLLGSFSFSQGYWGNLIVKINKLGPIKFRSFSQKKQKPPKILCFMKISIEYKKTTLKQINTECSQWISGQLLTFRTFLSHLFLQSKQQSDKKYLNFELFMISESSLKEKVFEKRYPLEDIFSHQMRNEKVNISVSQSDTNQLTEHFQMQLLFTNTKQLQNNNVFSADTFDQKALIETSLNNVKQIDMISYKNKSFIDFLKMILSTQDATHFQGYLKEIKQSFIYEEITFDSIQSPFALLITVLPYLGTNARFCYKDVLQMLEMSIMKNPIVIKYLDDIKLVQNQPFLYKLFKSIIDRDNKEQFLKKQIGSEFQLNKNALVSIFTEINKKQISKISFQKLFTKSNILKLSQCIESHSNLFNQRDISVNYLNDEVIKLLLSIISQIIQHSENFLQSMSQHIDEWIEFAAYKSEPILTKMIEIVDKINLNHRELIDLETYENLIKILLNRKASIDSIYQYWLRLSDSSKGMYFQEILAKYYLSEESNQNQKQQTTKQISQFKEIQKTRILRLFYVYLVKSLKRQIKSQKASRIVTEMNDKQSQKGSRISRKHAKVQLNPDLLKYYQALLQRTINQSDNVSLLNAISELITTWKDLNTLSEQATSFFLTLSKNYLQKGKKQNQLSKTKNNFKIKEFLMENDENQNEIRQIKLLNEKNKKSVIENLINTLKGKEKPIISNKPKKQTEKQSQGFAKYSKYLISR